MKHFASSGFWGSYQTLPGEIQRLANRCFGLLKEDPAHPSLQFKKVGRFRSARVGLHYRALGVEVADGEFASTLNRVLTGTSGISPEMALRLSKAFGRSLESWLAMQYNYDLWQAKQNVDLGNVSKVRLTAA